MFWTILTEAKLWPQPWQGTVMTLLTLHYTVLHGHTTDFKKVERLTSYKSNEVCRETRNEPTEIGLRPIKISHVSNNISCHCQLLQSSTCTLHTVPHRPRHALAVRVSGTIIASVRGKVPGEQSQCSIGKCVVTFMTCRTLSWPLN